MIYDDSAAQSPWLTLVGDWSSWITKLCLQKHEIQGTMVPFLTLIHFTLSGYLILRFSTESSYLTKEGNYQDNGLLPKACFSALAKD